MTPTGLDRTVAWTAVGLGLAVFLWLWGQAPWVALWPVVSAVAALVAAALVWTDVVPGKPVDGLGALVGLVLVGEGVFEYLALPTVAWPGQVVAWSLVALFAGVAGYRGTGWRTGFRVGLGAAVVATGGQAVVFGAWLGQPVQAVVLEAQGAMARFDAAKATDFLAWAVGDFWSSLAPQLVLGAALGGLSGWVGRRRSRG